MRFSISTLLVVVAIVDGKERPLGGYNYSKGGDNWATEYADLPGNMCGEDSSMEQSPINLLTSGPNVFKDKDMNIELVSLVS